MEKEIEESVLQYIVKRKEAKVSFDTIVSSFKEKLSTFNPTKNYFKISDYFLPNAGLASIITSLVDNGIVKSEWLNKERQNDFKGIYVFLYQHHPFYVGISKGVIGRIIQHVKGHNHFQSTLAYNISMVRHEIINGSKYQGKRSEYDFKGMVKPTQEFLLNQNIAFFPIEDDIEMYLFEVYCAMELQCGFNSFTTH